MSQINLRALKKSDSNLILNWMKNEKLRYLIGTVYPITELEHENWFQNRMLEKDNRMFVIDLDNKKSIGIVGFKNLDWVNRNSELFIYIGDEEYWGKGYGTQALELIIKFAFNKLNLHMLYLEVFSYNKNATKTYERLGFKQDGILRQSKFQDGKYYDKIIMSKINE
ncbi:MULTISPECIES: GNAT family N-acetyltransferase [Staphylococcus]|uniref:GNAT family N-acetyltransferase n=1 Tax=Staphylococcus TaxID=1279 RepID=UPI0007523FFF|nr:MULTISPECIES: GNAT family protein [Staphylococcus]MBD3928075.1 GNAT family N-acetyltransferase [Staphylococcus haemolyticus]MBF2215422.1 GNAT family N-acetyltransferase [Staphylococcus haemolyticus]MBF2217823.1 GNAT family N-acetyltransferase [Staphylococcus haemolyticus]MBF2220247.1 GNAT family N-acetyltransferase [Staphylococcus haemolyticus]MBF2234539.1 GNAT family N-acetyltransferase [Staphylococcus haemolyticus]